MSVAFVNFSPTYAYDANGSMTGRGKQTIIWDVESRISQVQVGGSPIATFAYDGRGVRVKKTEGGETVIYVNRYYTA